MPKTQVTYLLEDMRGGEINVIDLTMLSKAFIDSANKIGINVSHGGAELLPSEDENADRA